MKTFFKDLFDYHHHFNQQIAEQLEQNISQISDRTIPMFSHMINAHQIWNARIIQSASVGVNDMRSLQENKVLDASNYQDSLKILEQYDLSSTWKYQTSKGESFSNTIQDILFHVVNHHTHHRGQIISDLRQAGITPLITDYIFFKR